MKLLFKNKKYLVSIFLTILMVFLHIICQGMRMITVPLYSPTAISTTRSIAENTASGVNISNVIAATDAG